MKINATLKFLIGIIFITAISILIIASIIIISTSTPPQQTPSPNWEEKKICSQWASVYPVTEDIYNCKLENCTRLDTTSGTDVEECKCTTNQKPVYRYCINKMLLYEYTGDTNATKILHINNTHTN